MASEPSKEAVEAAWVIVHNKDGGGLSATEAAYVIDRHFTALRKELTDAYDIIVYDIPDAKDEQGNDLTLAKKILRLSTNEQKAHKERDAALSREERWRHDVEEFIYAVDQFRSGGMLVEGVQLAEKKLRDALAAGGPVQPDAAQPQKGVE